MAQVWVMSSCINEPRIVTSGYGLHNGFEESGCQAWIAVRHPWTLVVMEHIWLAPRCKLYMKRLSRRWRMERELLDVSFTWMSDWFL